jgi:hypothetical protein
MLFRRYAHSPFNAELTHTGRITTQLRAGPQGTLIDRDRGVAARPLGTPTSARSASRHVPGQPGNRAPGA